jgi:hypothetical protein
MSSRVTLGELMDVEGNPPAKLRLLLDDYQRVDPESILRADLGVEFNFAELEPTLLEVYAFLKRLSELPLETLGPNLASYAIDQLETLRGRYQEIQQFSAKGAGRGGNPERVRADAIAGFKGQWTVVMTALAPIAGYLAAYRINEEPERIAIASRDAEKVTSRIRDMESEVNTVLEAVRKASAEVSVAKHAQHFSEEAKRHGDAASKWLTFVGLAGAATILLAGFQWWLVWTKHPVLSNAQSAQLIFSKALVFSVAISATVWCGRVYRALRHNEIVNRHRANALSSFEALAEGTDDAATKNAVLMQATNSIFGMQPSGFSANDAESAGPSQLVELIRTLPSAKS